MHFFKRGLYFCLLAGIAMGSSAASFTADELEIAESLREKGLEENLAWDVLESLTTEVGPRMGGSENDLRAVAWAEKKLQDMGFDRVWKEPVTFQAWHRGIEKAQIVSPFPQQLVVTALGGSGPTPEGGLEAEIAHFETYQELKLADEDEVKGKIVYISNRMKRARDGSGYGPAVAARRSGAVEAGKKGALAIVIRSIGTDSHRMAHTGAMQMAEVEETIPALALSAPDADMIERQMKRGKPVVLHLESGARRGDTYTSYNVIGQLDGSEMPDQMVLIGGHLDSWDLGTGAIDDGAGVAITAAAADLIRRLPERPKRSVRVVFWASEEFGLIGAKQYREQHKHELHKIQMGSESDFGAGRIYRLTSRVRPEALAAVAQIASILEPLGISLGHNHGSGGPDLIPMQKDGVPMMRLMQDGTDYFDYHHTPDDTLDKVDPESLRQNVAAWAVMVYLAAQSDIPFGPYQTAE